MDEKGERTPPEEEVRFHYDRSRRLERIHRNLYPAGPGRRWLGKKRTRSMLIILVDLIIIAGVYYFVSRPANIFLKKPAGDVVYELNVSGIRGKKILIGFTVRNTGEELSTLQQPSIVNVSLSREGEPPVVGAVL